MPKKEALTPFETRRVQHQVCLSKEERDLIDLAAKRQGLHRASFMRQAAMDAAHKVLGTGPARG